MLIQFSEDPEFFELPKSKQAKAEGELTAARRLYQSTDLCGATVTADALHCEGQSMHEVVEAGGDFLFQLKENQPNTLRRAESIEAAGFPLLFAVTPMRATGSSKSGW